MPDAYLQIRSLKSAPPREDWFDKAACRGMPPSVFHPNGVEEQALPKSICQKCPVREECLAYAQYHQINHGVWGGESERARRRLRHPYSKGH